MNEPEEQAKYIPTPEELAGDSYEYCYGSQVVIPPQKDDGDPNPQ